MKSWMMELWLKNYEKSKWPDLSIIQPEDACHVSIKDENQTAIEEMCSEGFFTVHGYRYVQCDATAERVPEELYDDITEKNCTGISLEELYEEAGVPLACQLRSGCHLRSPQELPDPHAFPIDPRYKNIQVEPRYQNVEIDGTKTNLQEEELYDDVRSTKGAVDPRVFSTEPRYQNVQIKTEVGMVTEVPRDDEAYDDVLDKEQIEDESEIYEEIGNKSPALCHSAGTDKHMQNFGSESKYSYSAEDVGKETSDPEDEDLYEEIAGAVISNSVEACSLKSPGSSDESSEAVGCDEFTSNPENGSVPAKEEVQNHDDPVYAEIGSLRLTDMQLSHNTGCQSTHR